MSSYGDFNNNLIADLRAHHGKATSGPFVGRDVLILTTTGARSGEVRVSPLVYSREGDDYVVVASKGGAPTNPSWYHNLRAHPEITVEVGNQKFKARAHVVGDDEYDRLYGQHATTNPAFLEYRTRTSRHIPVVVLKKIG